MPKRTEATPETAEPAEIVFPDDLTSFALVVLSGNVGPYLPGERFLAEQLGHDGVKRALASGQVAIVDPNEEAPETAEPAPLVEPLPAAPESEPAQMEPEPHSRTHERDAERQD